MEMNERKVIEVFLAIILVLILIGIIFLFTGKTTSSSGEQASSISQSYNTNSYNTYNVDYPSSTRSLRDDGYVYYDSERYDDYRYYDREDRYDRDTRYDYLDYKSDIDVIKTDRYLGDYTYEYVVYVKNLDYTGGYFTVKFYFEDYYGRETTRSVTHYVKAREEEKFHYKDVNANQYDYYDWDYKVTSHTKIPDKYYDYTDKIRYIDDPIRVKYVSRY
jgi:hypothetical protein